MLDVDLLERLVEVSSSLGEALGARHDVAGRFEAPVRARVDAGASRATRSSAPSCGASERARSSSGRRPRRSPSVRPQSRSSWRGSKARPSRRSDGSTRRSRARCRRGAPRADDDGDVDRDELAARITRLDARREALGKVNPLAREEYEAEKERLDELTAPARRPRARRSASSPRSATS